MPYQNQDAPQERDVTQHVVPMLKTVLLLERSYGAGYLVRILQGDETYGLRQEGHRELETFGLLAEERFSYLDSLLQVLIEDGFLEVKDARYGTVSITQQGRDFLAQPGKLLVLRDRLKKPWHEIEAMRSLRELRKRLAGESGLQPFEVLSNYSIGEISRNLPRSEAELSHLPGLDKVRPFQRKQLIEELRRVNERKDQDDRTGVYTRAYSWSHRKVRELFEGGMDIEEIARRQKLTAEKVVEYLETLHQAGLIDLKPWIESSLDAKTLHRAAEYFRQVKSSLLREAREVLGYDTLTLRLCRVYASRAEEPPMAYAS